MTNWYVTQQFADILDSARMTLSSAADSSASLFADDPLVREALVITGSAGDALRGSLVVIPDSTIDEPLDEEDETPVTNPVPPVSNPYNEDDSEDDSDKEDDKPEEDWSPVPGYSPQGD